MSIRRSLSDILNGLADNPEDEFALAEIEEAYQVAGEAETFRYHAPTTEARRDLHLREVLNFYRACKHLPRETTTDDEIRRQLFGSSHADVLRFLKGYFSIALKFCKPRAATDQRPRFQTLLSRRFSMIFWVNRLMPNPIARMTFINATNRVLQYAGRKYGVNKSLTDKKPYMGRFELAQLLEADMMKAVYMPLSENHHLAWCLGLICGVRPGTMAQAAYRNGHYLAWKDCVISRGASPGQFHVKVTFLFLKGNRDDPSKQDYKAFTINSPTVSEFIPMSPAHRMLVILLRRGYLRDHADSKSLLAGKERFIAIKDDAKPLPVLLGGGPRGLSVTDAPMSSRNLSRYMSSIASDEGYGPGVTIYAWRRKAGTEIHRQKGVETAQLFMGHQVGTDTFFRSYDQGSFDLPVFEIAMRQDTQAAGARMEEDASLILTRFDTLRTKGVFLDRVIRRVEVSNKELIDAVGRGDPREIKNVRRRIQRAAAKSLYDQEQKLAAERQTVDEFLARKDELRIPGSLMKKIISMSEKTLKDVGVAEQSGSVTVAGQGASSGPTRAVADDMPYTDLRDEDDHDPELDTVVDVDPENAEVTTDSRGEPAEVEESADEFLDAVDVFFQCMGQDRFVPVTVQGLYCQLCLDDPNMDTEDKEKVWSNSTKLRIHERSKIHCSKMAILRKLNKICVDEDGKAHWVCPYSSDENPCNNGHAFSDRATLVRHIERSTVENSCTIHDEDKRADGWYEPDFNYDPSSNIGRVTLGRKRMHLEYSKEMESEPREISPGIWEAPGPVPYPIPPQYRGIVFSGDQVDVNAQLAAPIPDKYKGMVFELDEKGMDEFLAQPIPEEYKGIVFSVEP